MFRAKNTFQKFQNDRGFGGRGRGRGRGRGGRGARGNSRGGRGGRGSFRPFNSSFPRPKPLRTSREREIHSKLQKVESNLQPKRMEEEIADTQEVSAKTQVLLDNLRRQLEFYFGDPNLTKDKNLREIMMRDSRKKGYVDLNTFLTFNRVKEFFVDNEVESERERHRYLEKAIKRSSLLKLDSAKDNVRRRVPFDHMLYTSQKFKESVSDRTIFVEHLPRFVEQEILAKVFQEHGKILYISIPKDKDKKMKGFAFIEYADKREATKSLSEDGKIPEIFKHPDLSKDSKPLRVMSKAEWFKIRDQDLKPFHHSKLVHRDDKRSKM